MLDIKLIRKEKERVERLLKRKETSLSLTPLLELDSALRQLKTEEEEYQAKRNSLSKQVGERKQKGENADDLKEEVRLIGEKIASLEQKIREIEPRLHTALAELPNLPFEEIPDSPDAKDNVCLKEVGTKPHFSFAAKNHVELNQKLGLFDFERGVKTSGSGWVAYRGLGARLEWALLNYMMEEQQKRGFELWIPPLLVRRETLYGSGQIPKFDGQYYEVLDRDHSLYLIPTAEVVLNGLHAEEILPESALPLKYAAYTPCFRKEAGAAGAGERGLIRTHQFNKVEMFCFCKPEQSAALMEEMIASAEGILQGLELHYRLSLLVTGDMSFTAAKTIDIEVFLPGQNRYYEVSSVSNCTDYQARRSQIRTRAEGGKPEYVHTLNGSGLATSRLMVALLENNQQSDGSIRLPRVLQERLGCEKIG